MDLQNPRAKMSKSADSPMGTVLLLDPPEVIEHKITRALTDAESGEGAVRYDPAEKPGVSNLLELLGAATDRSPAEAAVGYTQYGRLKADTAAAVIEMVRPIQDRYRALGADEGLVEKILRRGAEKARAVASVTLGRAQTAMGLLPRANDG
jgi:tryptophanyl-tRNA synthetase